MFSRFFAISSGSSTFSRKSFIPADRNTSESNSSTRREVLSRFPSVSVTSRMFERPTSTASPPGERNGRITLAISATEMYCSGKARMVTWLGAPFEEASPENDGSSGSVFASAIGTMWYVFAFLYRRRAVEPQDGEQQVEGGGLPAAPRGCARSRRPARAGRSGS